MSDSHRNDFAALKGLVAALGALGVLGLLAVVVSSVQIEQQRAHSQQDYTRNGAVESLFAECAVIDRGERAGSDQRCATARDQADLSAQQSMARAAWAQFWLNLVSAGLLGATVFFAYRAWREAKRSAKAGKRAAKHTKRQADIAERHLMESRIPELFLDVPDASIKIRDRTVVVPEASLRITNVGPTLAVYTGGMANLVFARRAVDVPNPATPEFFATKPSILSVKSIPLPPNSSPVLLPVVCLDSAILKDRVDGEPLPPLALRGPNFFLVGWIEFKNQWGEQFTQSFCFFYSAPSTVDAPEVFTEFENVPKVKAGAFSEYHRALAAKDRGNAG